MEKIRNISRYIETKCGTNSLCLDTCEHDCLERVYTLNNKRGSKTPQSCFNILNDWKSHTKLLTNNYIQSISIIIRGPVNINGNIINMSLFTHGFNLIGNSHSFVLCDSWMGIHLMKCRKKNTLTLQDVTAFMESLLTLSPNLKQFDLFFNDDNKSDWESQTESLKGVGEWTQEYSSEDTISKLIHYEPKSDVKFTLDIKVYKIPSDL